VYLAADLEFLIPDLVIAGCEVHLMKSSSIRHNPGAMWRFLAFEETDKLVTLVDADRAANPLPDIVRTETTAKAGLGFWRVPVWGGLNDEGNLNYRPIVGCQMGCTTKLPARLLMEALIWQTRRGGISKLANPPGSLPVTVHGTMWPDYGFDEWFLQAALYPRAAFEGLLTFIPASAKSQLLPLDIAFTMWANPASEIQYFGSNGSPCCEPEYKKGTFKPGKPRSRSFVGLVKEGVLREQALQPLISKRKVLPRATLVVARYKEDLAWLAKVDPGIRVVVYNKGPVIRGGVSMERIDQLIQLPNQGREADTYLAHLQSGRTEDDGAHTIFCQGDPFPHSPDFLELLAHRDHWGSIQPLTSGYIQELNLPPEFLVNREQGQWLGKLRIRSETFSPWTLQTLAFYDAPATDWMNGFHRRHGTPRDWSVTGYFMDLVGLPEVAREAWTHYSGQFAYGAIFAVAEHRLDHIPRKSLAMMRKLACDDPLHGYVFERLWLHLFGLPFSMPEQAKVAVASSQSAR
jgi:hypothetical protein